MFSFMLQVLRDGVDQAWGDRGFETESGNPKGRRRHLQIQTRECDDVRVGDPRSTLGRGSL